MAGVVNMPEEAFRKLKNSVPVQWKVCLFTAVVMGLIAHLYKITNWLPNWDSLVFRVDPQNMTGLGRWFLSATCALSSFYDLPFLNGILAIAFHGLGAVCICKIFDVKKSITAGLIGALTVSFPVVTSVMMYNYVSDGYAIGFFMACLAAVFITAEKPRYILGVLLITLSVATYQSYISVTAMLLLFSLIKELAFKKESLSKTVKKSLSYSLCGIAGLLAYYGILMLIVSISGEALSDYQGVKSTTDWSNIDFYMSVISMAVNFVTFFFDFSKGLSIFTVLNILMFFSFAAFGIALIIKKKSYKNAGRLFFTLLCVALLPFGASLLIFMNPNLEFHNLMKMSYCVFFVFFIVLYELKIFKSNKNEKMKCWFVFVVACLMIFTNIVISNVSYHKAQLAWERSFAELVKISDRIDCLDGSADCEKLLVSGAIRGSEAYSVNLPPDMTGITDNYILRKDDESVGQSVVCSAINDYCRKNYRFLSGDEKQNLLNNPEVVSMPHWPDKGSVKIVDGVIVLKLGQEE